ncbi:hypothetical protein EVAR_47672_1 [Eumeta japonica]|uniref:Uncharacterized protein n=1 Tax=Eumeta variegata TaxID=151549 RepID=A0A4C1XYI1_EUMVA|nr:hypothetical protein EVAR_47672_1 [Eumeta japonica]
MLVAKVYAERGRGEASMCGGVCAGDRRQNAATSTPKGLANFILPSSNLGLAPPLLEHAPARRRSARDDAAE